MASRDKSQGFGFLYADIADLLAQRNELEKTGAILPSSNAKHINFNKDPMFAKQQPKSPIAAVGGPALPDQTQERKQAIHQIRENLDRLQSLHHKLHAMLEELNGITDHEKKKN